MGEARRKRMQNRFKKMANDGGRPIMPEGYSAPLEKTLILTHPAPKTTHHYAHIEPPKAYVEDLLLRSQTEDKPHTKTHTSAALWRDKGEPDPHGNYYDVRERHEIMGGQFTDDEIAYKCGMASGRDLESISTLHLAKERIRWLSRKLVAAEKRIQELEGKK